jgi:hypothetical protein
LNQPEILIPLRHLTTTLEVLGNVHLVRGDVYEAKSSLERACPLMELLPPGLPAPTVPLDPSLPPELQQQQQHHQLFGSGFGDTTDYLRLALSGVGGGGDSHSGRGAAGPGAGGAAGGAGAGTAAAWCYGRLKGVYRKADAQLLELDAEGVGSDDPVSQATTSPPTGGPATDALPVPVPVVEGHQQREHSQKYIQAQRRKTQQDQREQFPLKGAGAGKQTNLLGPEDDDFDDAAEAEEVLAALVEKSEVAQILLQRADAVKSIGEGPSTAAATPSAVAASGISNRRTKVSSVKLSLPGAALNAKTSPAAAVTTSSVPSLVVDSAEAASSGSVPQSAGELSTSTSLPKDKTSHTAQDTLEISIENKLRDLRAPYEHLRFSAREYQSEVFDDVLDAPRQVETRKNNKGSEKRGSDKGASDESRNVKGLGLGQGKAARKLDEDPTSQNSLESTSDVHLLQQLQGVRTFEGSTLNSISGTDITTPGVSSSFVAVDLETLLRKFVRAPDKERRALLQLARKYYDELDLNLPNVRNGFLYLLSKSFVKFHCFCSLQMDYNEYAANMDIGQVFLEIMSRAVEEGFSFVSSELESWQHTTVAAGSSGPLHTDSSLAGSQGAEGTGSLGSSESETDPVLSPQAVIAALEQKWGVKFGDNNKDKEINGKSTKLNDELLEAGSSPILLEKSGSIKSGSATPKKTKMSSSATPPSPAPNDDSSGNDSANSLKKNMFSEPLSLADRVC